MSKSIAVYMYNNSKNACNETEKDLDKNNVYKM